MQVFISPLFAILYLVIGLFSNRDFEPVIDEYLSPQHMYYVEENKQLYVGLSSYPGVAVYQSGSSQISEIIPMPSPVEGVSVEHEQNMLFAAAGKHQPYIFVYNLSAKKRQKSIAVGHGPTDLAIAKKAGLLFSANRFSNDISVIDLRKQQGIKRIKVSREPVALALSPTEIFLAVANLLPTQSSTESYVSANISIINVEKLKVSSSIELPNGSYNLKDIKFSHDDKYIYVTHLLGRYNVLTNQIEKGWINTNALSIIDASSMSYFTTVLLDDIHKGAANPSGIHLSEDGKNLSISITGTNELFVIDREAMHAQIERTKEYQITSQTTESVSAPDEKIKLFERPNQYKPLGVRFEDIPKELSFLAPVRKRILLNGQGPMNLEGDEKILYISSYFSDGIEMVNLENYQPESFMKIGNRDPKASQGRYGELLFHSAEKCFQQWQSCASCHPGEGRVDGLNWDLMNDGIGNPKNTKSLLLSHKTPPAMATGIRADAETGVRAGFKFIQFFDVSEKDAQAVDAYLKSLKPVPSPYLIKGKMSKSAERGKLIFDESGCATCHSGPYFTDMQQYEIGKKGPYDKQSVWDTPALIELWRSAPYLHDGRYNSLEDVFLIEKHGLKEDLSQKEVEELSEYLLSN